MLVVFEGHDGVGKTFLSNKLSSHLTEKGFKVFHNKTPDPIFSEMRDFVDNQNNLKNSFLFYLMSSLFAYMQSLIHSRNNIIILDRYIYSTIASHSARGYEIPVNLLNILPKPDYLFWITASEDVRKKRISSRTKKDCKSHDLSSLDAELIYSANNIYKKFEMTVIDNSLNYKIALRQILDYIGLKKIGNL